MANLIYSNAVLAKMIEDRYDSYLNLMQFCTVDNSLELNEGMKKKIHRYSATSGVEKVTMGQGNTKDIESAYVVEEYDIELYQNRTYYYDEEVMTDGTAVETRVKMLPVDMYNKVNSLVYAEFKKAPLVTAPTKFDFGAFVDACALLDINENLPAMSIFGIVHPSDMADIRKNLKDDLKYVEAFVRNGYVGTVAGVNLYTKRDATPKTVIIGTKEAVTHFNKRGTEVDQNREPNIRKNNLWYRKYGVTALTDARKVVKMQIGGTANSTITNSNVTIAGAVIRNTNAVDGTGTN